MQAIKPNWSIAKQISRRHSIISLLITTGVMLFGLGVLTLVFLYLGVELSWGLYGDVFKKYGGLISMVIMPIHLIPVNFYAIIRVLQYPFKDFRIVVYDVSHAVETDAEDHGELPTIIK